LIQAGDATEGIESHLEARELFLAAGAVADAAVVEGNIGQARARLAVERNDPALEKQAIADLTHAAEVLTKEWGADHPDAALFRESLAELHVDRGRCRAAVPLAETALAAYETQGPDHPFAAGPLVLLGRCHLAAGRRSEARAAFERALKLRRASGGDPAATMEIERLLASTAG
jgi:tetratricopeptide (TPR) repeat protein